MTHYIFVVNDTDGEIKKRISEERWPVFDRTPYAKRIKNSDRIIIYRGGQEGGKFIADAVVAGSSTGKYVPLNDITVWKTPVSIHGLLDEISIIKNPLCYGVYLAGGIREITKADFDLITDPSRRP